jgi:hypothetical protein
MPEHLSNVGQFNIASYGQNILLIYILIVALFDFWI